MNKRYVEVVTNKDLNKIEALNDFCLHNDIENVSKNILTSKDNNNSSTLYIYIDKDLGLVYKIDSTIDNLNNTSYDANKLEYKIEIINTKLNNNKAINLPFNENN